MKAALNRLNIEHVVEIRPRSGTFVREISLAEAQELLKVRLMMEIFAIDEARELDAGTGRLMTQAIEGMEQVLHQRPFDWVKYNSYDVEFHRQLVGLARNRILSDQYSQLHFHHVTGRYWLDREEKTRRDHPDHAHILTALNGADWASAKFTRSGISPRPSPSWTSRRG